MGALQGKTIFITGASSGIGKACAEAFAKEGSHLILAARRADRLLDISKDLANRYGAKTKTYQLDVRNQAEVKNTVSSFLDDFKKIDILINNAGLAKGFSKIYEGNILHWEEMIDTNIKGLLYVTREILPLMIENGSGHVINIGSTAGHDVYQNGNVYCATKFAVNALTQSIRIDVLDKNIKVSTVDPGMVETEFSLVRYSGDNEKAKNTYKGVKPLTAEDVASAVLFCASQPEHVNINEIIITPSIQASSNHIFRK
ncbi:MAG TPA: SDR family NAD(P)-dependent oxidoreductase [Ignavibacteriaceae bacterium]|nr:SDR family NAD(P)-dependent oxidoreductase [Ignavibacteriaceae bacterium]